MESGAQANGVNLNDNKTPSLFCYVNKLFYIADFQYLIAQNAYIIDNSAAKQYRVLRFTRNWRGAVSATSLSKCLHTPNNCTISHCFRFIMIFLEYWKNALIMPMQSQSVQSTYTLPSAVVVNSFSSPTHLNAALEIEMKNSNFDFGYRYRFQFISIFLSVWRVAYGKL